MCIYIYIHIKGKDLRFQLSPHVLTSICIDSRGRVSIAIMCMYIYIYIYIYIHVSHASAQVREVSEQLWRRPTRPWAAVPIVERTPKCVLVRGVVNQVLPSVSSAHRGNGIGGKGS